MYRGNAERKVIAIQGELLYRLPSIAALRRDRQEAKEDEDANISKGCLMKRVNSLFLALAALYCLAFPLKAHSREQLTLLIHPYLPPTELYKKFSPLAAYLTSETGKKVIVKISKGYQQHIDTIGNDQMDLAYMGPAAYVEMTEKYGKKPLLACQEISGKPFLHGMIIVKSDSAIKTLAGLAGKRFAFVDRESTMGYFLPRVMMQEAGLKLEQLGQADFLNSHPNVALAVLHGYYDAGAVKDDTFYTYQGRGLKMLAQSPPVQEHIFLASSRMPEALVATIRQALLNLHDPRILTGIQSTLTGLVAVKDEDYDTLRRIMRTVKQADQ